MNKNQHNIEKNTIRMHQKELRDHIILLKEILNEYSLDPLKYREIQFDIKQAQEWIILLSKKKIYKALLQRFGNVCWYCCISLDKEELFPTKKGHIEHITARKKGGEDELSNLALSCPMCNSAKSTLKLYQFISWLAHIRSNNFQCHILNVKKSTALNDLFKQNKMQNKICDLD